MQLQVEKLTPTEVTAARWPRAPRARRARELPVTGAPAGPVGNALMLGPPGGCAPVPAPLPVADSGSHIIVPKAISNAAVPSYQGSFDLHSG